MSHADMLRAFQAGRTLRQVSEEFKVSRSEALTCRQKGIEQGVLVFNVPIRKGLPRRPHVPLRTKLAGMVKSGHITHEEALALTYLSRRRKSQ